MTDLINKPALLTWLDEQMRANQALEDSAYDVGNQDAATRCNARKLLCQSIYEQVRSGRFDDPEPADDGEPYWMGG